MNDCLFPSKPRVSTIMNCTSEILHLIPLVQQQLEASQSAETRLIGSNFGNSLNELVLSPKNHEDQLTKKRNLLECVSFLSSTLLYLFLCSSDYSKLIEIELKASSVDKQENEESKVVPD